MLAMTHRYIFLFIETANQMFESRQSRMIGALSGPEQRRVASRTAGVLLSKSIDLSEEVYLAMQSRGFRGDIQLITEFRMHALDYAGLAACLAFACGRRMDREVIAGWRRSSSWRTSALTMMASRRSIPVARLRAGAARRADWSQRFGKVHLVAAARCALLSDGRARSSSWVSRSPQERLGSDTVNLNFRRQVGLVFQNPGCPAIQSHGLR